MTTDPIQNGQTPNADTLFNYPVGILFKNQAQLLYNAARIGFNSKLNVATGVPNLKNIKYDCMLTDVAATKTNFTYSATDKNYYTERYYKAASILTDATEVNYSTNGTFTLKKTLNVNPDAGVFECTANIKNTGDSNGSIVRYKYYYSDATTADVDVATSDSNYHAVTFTNPQPAKTVTQIEVYLSRQNSSGTVYEKDSNVFGISEPTTNTLIFQTTSLPTITDCIATWNSLIDSQNTLAVTISADGTNYEAVTDATIKRFTNTGTNIFIKFVITRVDLAATDKISEYAVLYNVGAS